MTKDILNFNADSDKIDQMLVEAMETTYPSYMGSLVSEYPNCHFGYRPTHDQDGKLNLDFQGWWKNDGDEAGYFVASMTLKTDNSWEIWGEHGLKVPPMSRKLIGYQAIEFALHDPHYTFLKDMYGLGLISLPESE